MTIFNIQVIRKRIVKLLTTEVPTPSKSIYINLFLIIISVFLLSVVIEVCYRVHMWYNPQVVINTSIGPQFNPNTIGYYKGGKTSIDEFGFRNGIDPTIWKKDKKIMLIGDSVGFGHGVDDNQTISHKLNEAFNESNIGFLNLCNPGWDTLLLRNRLYTYGSKLGPWDTIIWMYYINDAKHSIRYFPPSISVHYKEDVSTLDRFLNVFKFSWIYTMKKRISNYNLSQKNQKDTRRSSWDAYYKWCLSAYEPETVTRKNEKALIRDIVLWSQENNSKIIFVIFPAENQLVDGNRQPQVFIENLAEEFRFPVIDLIPYLIEASKKGKIYLTGDTQHLNAFGNEIVSNVTKNWLISNGYEQRASH